MEKTLSLQYVLVCTHELNATSISRGNSHVFELLEFVPDGCGRRECGERIIDLLWPILQPNVWTCFPR